MKEFLIGLIFVFLLPIIGTLIYFAFFHDDEPEPFEPHPLVKELLESYKIAENYNRDRMRLESTYYLGESVFIVAEDGGITISIIGNNQQMHVFYSLDETMIARNTRLYYETYLYADDEWMIEDEAWGKDFRDDEYVQIDMSNKEFIEALEELTMEDWLFFQGELK